MEAEVALGGAPGVGRVPHRAEGAGHHAHAASDALFPVAQHQTTRLVPRHGPGDTCRYAGRLLTVAAGDGGLHRPHLLDGDATVGKGLLVYGPVEVAGGGVRHRTGQLAGATSQTAGRVDGDLRYQWLNCRCRQGNHLPGAARCPGGRAGRRCGPGSDRLPYRGLPPRRSGLPPGCPRLGSGGR